MPPPTPEPVRLAVVGAGLVGAKHAAMVAASSGAELAAIIDPAEPAKMLADRLGVAWGADLDAYLPGAGIDGVIIATPNQMHLAHGLAAIRAGLPALIEKPIADTVDAAEELVAASDAAGVPLLIGHHRRHNPLIRAAAERIASGALGRIVAVHGFFWLYKPDDYFATAWRRQAGAGPVFINLIHDIDLLRHLCGEIVRVQAVESHAVRGFEVEDTAAMILHFASGALGTFSLSDSIVAPWSWEQTAGENPAYPRTDQSCYTIGGTHGALALPGGTFWSAAAERSWWQPLRVTRDHIPEPDPLEVQLDHFCDVVRGRTAPLVPAREGAQSLRVIAALKAAAESGAAIRLDQIP